jgi:alkylated DNA nucleotide flippase Atl1
MSENTKDKVFKMVKKVPRGKVTTYGEIARHLGMNPRIVGWMLHLNRSESVPCHRIVDRTGRLAPNFGGPSLVSFGRRAPSKSRIAGRSGAFSAKGGPTSGGDGAKEQRRRLEVEGVKFKDPMHVDLRKSIWT